MRNDALTVAPPSTHIQATVCAVDIVNRLNSTAVTTNPAISTRVAHVPIDLN